MNVSAPYSPGSRFWQGHDIPFAGIRRLLRAALLRAALIGAALLRAALICAVLICFFAIGKVAAAEPLRVVYGFDREFPPFSYEEPGGKATGFEIELMQAVFADSDVELFYRPLQWDRVPLELSAGTVNLTTGMVRTEQRGKLYLFSKDPTFPLQIRLFTKIYNRFPSAALLRGQAVSVEKGSYQHRLLEESGGFNIKPYEGSVDGLRALYRDEVAAYCGRVQNTYYQINKLNYGAITTVGTPLGITEMRAAVARDRGDILRLLDEGMKKVVESGEYNRLYRKWFVRELSDQERDLMLKTAAGAAIPSYAPYGKSGGGAALLTATGKIFSACTVENADLSLSLSALRGAVSRAIADGEFEFRAVVSTDSDGKPRTPTPEDLQVLSEFSSGALVILSDKAGSFKTPMVRELLPHPVQRETNLVRVE